jgi:hypothetical protein
MATRRATATAAAIGITVAGLVGAAPASAGTAERGHYTDQYDYDVSACGTTINISGTTTGHFVAQLRGANPVPFYLDHFVDRTTFTNLATARSYIVVNRRTHLDVDYVEVSDTVIRVAGKDAGTASVYRQDGTLYYRLAGLERFTALIDTKGTEDGSDDEIIDAQLTQHGKFPTTDFCADVEALTG